MFQLTADVAATSITISVDKIVKKKDDVKLEINVDELTAYVKRQFTNQVFCIGQKFAIEFSGTKLYLFVDEFEHANLGSALGGGGSGGRGQLLPVTGLTWKKKSDTIAKISFVGADVGMQRNDSLFRSNFDFETMGIGGLGDQFQTMFRKAFASRLFPGLVKLMGISHVKGIILYGPPGCGKTLIARQIGKVLNAKEPKIVSGPEIFDSYVGGSEAKVRDLFKDAEKDMKDLGDESELHIIIFDEMDAIMKKRGSGGPGAGGNAADNVVNQLLSKIDGVDSLNNILIIGMTNRIDMIDEAILRPGRLEVHIEIPLPSEAGREQILRIKTNPMRENKRIDQEVIERLHELAEKTKNYTGAELEVRTCIVLYVR